MNALKYDQPIGEKTLSNPYTKLVMEIITIKKSQLVLNISTLER